MKSLGLMSGLMFLGSVLSFASLAIVHEFGPGECSREATARRELTVAHALAEHRQGLLDAAERRLAQATTRQIIEPRQPLVLPEPERVVPFIRAILDGAPVDELRFVDADIAAAFSGCIYLTGTPTEMQLARELRRFREESFFVRESHVRCAACDTVTRAGDVRPCSGCGGESPWVVAMRALIAPPAVTYGTDDAPEEGR